MDDPDICCLHGLTDYCLSALYSAALLTIVPSLEEGFGYPAVESMACGTPVLCSSAASLPEVAGGCAEMFSPNSAQEIADAICRVLDSKDLSQNLVTRGIERAAEFTAGPACSAYANLLRAVIWEQSMESAKLPAMPDSQPDR
jgi:glycosyltransferase involved in cell wall biosynthesis